VSLTSRESLPGAIEIRCPTTLGDHEVAGLSDVLMDCVAGGASVGFMLPLTRNKAEAFWRGVGASVARGERALLVAEAESGAIVGTAQVIWAPMENQPHRGELAKMLVHRRARGRGVGAALLTAAEAHALRAGKTLLVLDTASDTAERLYARHGWQRLGVIPHYALWPEGGLCSTTVFFKDLTTAAGRGQRESEHDLG
jgi:GNAT superfamily N-acetyltransferase